MQKDIKIIGESLSTIEKKILPFLENKIEFKKLVEKSKINETEVHRALQFLETKEIIKTEQTLTKKLVLTKIGEGCLKIGLPEERFLETIKNKTLSLEEIKTLAKLDQNEVSVSIGLLKRIGALETVKEKEVKFRINNLDKAVKTILETKELLKNLNKIDNSKQNIIIEIRKRGLIEEQEVKTIEIELLEIGRELQKIKLEETIEAVTSEVIRNKEYEKKKFRKYDIQGNVPSINPGRSHPLQEIINQTRKIFMNMGFKEMEGPLVETAFWCMDSMWIPQDHPARDVQDTFYLPYEGKIPEALAKKIAIEHETGGKCGSKGYGYKWDEKIAKQLLLRSHTTATTFRYLGEKNIKAPAKYFYIGRIFRNEALDATHLPEFHHSEGFVMGEGLTLRDLMGYIKEFYSQMGINKIKFRPTYNPYTEPSMEAIGYNEQLGKWVELINSGIFRPEALEPYGIKVPVIAWGLGIERLAMMLHQQKDIRNMLGATGDINWLRKHKVIKKW